jgi:Fur family ferric uptake transcriptional regulator
VNDELVRQALVRRGLRLTRQRAAVLEAVAGARGSFTAQQLHDDLRAAAPGIGLTTVYRTLDILAEIGAVERVHGLSHCEAFVAAGTRHSHTIICSNCGTASELADCGCDELVAAAARQTGFRIDDHVIQLSGICEACARNEVRAAAEWPAGPRAVGPDGEGAVRPAVGGDEPS